MKHSTLFIDESGKSSLAELKNDPFILTGVILDDEEIASIQGYFNYIKRKYNIDPTQPFHSYHIFECPETKISEANAKSLVLNLADFISLIPITIKVFTVNKVIFRKALGVNSIEDLKGSSERKEIREFPYRIMASKLFHGFAKYLRNTESIGQIVADSRVGGDYQLIKTLTVCKDLNRPLGAQEAKLIKEKCTAICFAEKNFLSGGVEITDLISYVCFFHARRMMKQMNGIKLGKLWYEIKKKMDENDLDTINEEDIRTFFTIKKGEVHKYLKIS